MAIVPTSGLYSNGVSQVFWKADKVIDDDAYGAYALVKPCVSAQECAVEHAMDYNPAWYGDYLAQGGTPPEDFGGSGEAGGEEEAPLGAPLGSVSDDGEYVEHGEEERAEADAPENRAAAGAPENRAEPFAPENRAAADAPKPKAKAVGVKKPGTAEAKLEGADDGDTA